MRRSRKSISLFPHFLFISSFSLHFVAVQSKDCSGLRNPVLLCINKRRKIAKNKSASYCILTKLRKNGKNQDSVLLYIGKRRKVTGKKGLYPLVYWQKKKSYGEKKDCILLYIDERTKVAEKAGLYPLCISVKEEKLQRTGLYPLVY